MAKGGKAKKKGGKAQKQQAAAASAAKDKRRNRVAEDKTFGLKNKNKSKRVQGKIAIIKQAAKNGGKNRMQLKAEKDRADARKKTKEAQKLQDAENRALGLSKNAKPCPFFLAGNCRRGKKCRFSHNAPAQQKSLNVYQDPRDTMENWDQSTLEDVVNKKDIRTATTTEIICKHFLDAIESKKYGHFWKCANGDDCIYRHCLPPGFILKSASNVLDKEEEIDIGEKIELERKKLNLLECTPLTHNLFLKWKVERQAMRLQEVEEERKSAAKKGGNRGTHVLNGRALFEFDPNLFQDDENAAADLDIQDEEEEGGAEGEAEQAEATAQPTEEVEEQKTKKKTKVKKKKKKKKKVAKTTATPTPAVVAVPVDASLFMDDEDLPDFDD